MRLVGRLDPRIYQCVTAGILTDAVIITDRQLEHIRERHPDDYAACEQWAAIMLQQPDYIIEANKPHTALVLKLIEENGKRYRLVLRIKTASDPQVYQNSIITFQKIKEKEWNRLLKNKIILYKKE